MFTFYIENHEPFEPLTRNCPKLDKNKSIVFRFLVFVVYKSAVSTIQKNNYVGCFNFRQWMLVFAHLFPDISIKSTKFHFLRTTARNNCAERHKDWKFPWYILDISIFVSVHLHSTIPIPPYKTKRFCYGNVWDEKTNELTWNMYPFHSTQNNRESRLVYK